MELRTVCKLLLTSKLLVLLSSHASFAQKQGRYGAIYSGVLWFDEKGNTVSAHGGGIITNTGRYYLFGEAHTDTTTCLPRKLHAA